jgi:hypothetical protein
MIGWPMLAGNSANGYLRVTWTVQSPIALTPVRPCLAAPVSSVPTMGSRMYAGVPVTQFFGLATAFQLATTSAALTSRFTGGWNMTPCRMVNVKVLASELTL